MTWSYSQTSGVLRHNNALIGKGYSGKGLNSETGRNNAEMESIKNVGPIPVGIYEIGLSFHHKKKGPVSMNLRPLGHTALGRTSLMIHGDNKDGNASEGCIILSLALRRRVAISHDRLLKVEHL